MEHTKYLVKPHFNGWCEVSEENFNRFIDNIRKHTPAMNEQQKQKHINQVTKIERRHGNV